MKLKLLLTCLCALFCGLGTTAFARNEHPSSGRPLEYDHWLTCEGAGDQVTRSSQPDIRRDTPQSYVDSHVPQFSGQYAFQVQDTWEEWVTHYGTSCSHCGEDCTTEGEGKDEEKTCTCNSCSWQELETFYRPWSVQTTRWHVQYIPSPDYRQRRLDWIRQGMPEEKHTASNLTALLQFDPDRPSDYYLFPGEVEKISVNNDSGETLEPSVSVKHSYFKGNNISWLVTTANGVQSNRLECDDVDLNINASIQAGQRQVTNPPNSIEFKTDWNDASKNANGQLTDEPFKFRMVDESALYYDTQSVAQHYKDTKVRVRLKEVDRYFWFDRFVSNFSQLKDVNSILKFHEDSDELPPFEEYEFNAADVFRTAWLHTKFHLKPGKIYQLCAQMYRGNNIYYKNKGFFGGQVWSDWNCATFTYSKQGPDRRRWLRKLRDDWTRWFLLPLPWY